MIVIPIQFIIALALGAIGVTMYIILIIAEFIHDAIRKWRKKHHENKS